MSVVEQFYTVTDFAQSQHRSMNSEASRERRLTIEEVNLESFIVFQLNLRIFTEMMTGQPTDGTEITLFCFYLLK